MSRLTQPSSQGCCGLPRNRLSLDALAQPYCHSYGASARLDSVRQSGSAAVGSSHRPQLRALATRRISFAVIRGMCSPEPDVLPRTQRADFLVEDGAWTPRFEGLALALEVSIRVDSPAW